MNKENLYKKIEKGRFLKAKYLTPKEKNELYDLMKKYGASCGFSYDRFFKEGFAEWELIGIDKVKADFIEEYKEELTMSVPTNSNSIGDRGYAAVLALDTETPGSFYNAIGIVKGLKKTFIERMFDLGMKSNATVYKRFTDDDWKGYERKGIAAIWSEFLENEQIHND